MKRTPIQTSEAERRSGFPVNPPNVRAGDGKPETEKSNSGIASSDALVGALPTFDVMPANSGRFTFGQQFDYDGGEDFIPDPVTVFDIALPNGYTTDVQWFRCNVIKVGNGSGGDLGIPPDGYFLTIYLDGVAEVFNQNIFVLPFDGFYPCRVIGEGGQRVTVKASFPYAGLYTIVETVTTLTGQMLVKNRQQPQNAPLVQPQLRVQQAG